MSSLKIHVIKGVNSYTDNLVKTEQRNINRRREVNFNVGNLGANQRSSSRAKSFAVYKPPSRPKHEPKEEQEIKSINPEETYENETDKSVNESTGDAELNYEANQANYRKNQNEDGFDMDESQKGESDDDLKNYTFEEVKNKKNEEEDDEDGFGGYLFSSNREREDSVSITFSDDNKAGGKFKKFTDKLKETFDQNNLKQKHDKNMENMRKQFKSMMGKKGEQESDTEASEGSDVDYWGAPGETNFKQTDGTARAFGPNRLNSKHLNYDSDNGSMKRCCC